VVPAPEEDGDGLPTTPSDDGGSRELVRRRGADEERELDTRSLEDLWREHAFDWDVATQELLQKALTAGTLNGYNGMLQRFQNFCSKHGYVYFPATSATIAHFFRVISQNTQRPGTVLLTASAAIGAMYRGSTHSNPAQSDLLTLLKQAIVATGTKRPRKSTPVFPIEKLMAYLITLGGNDDMTIDNVRAKAICLLALVGLYRPSDLEVLRMEHLQFTDAGVNVANFGGKTDKSRDGIPTTITRASDPRLCPVLALRAYLNRTTATRASIPDQPVFVYLDRKKPGALGNQRIAKILGNALKEAGIDDTTAKSFRKTGASKLINAGVHSDMVMKLGRWKSPDVFYKHYVDWAGADLTNTLLRVPPATTSSSSASSSSSSSSS
jgi:integrase